MTAQEFNRRMAEIYPDDWADLFGAEAATHRRADALMCKFLREAGCGDGIDRFENATKWYE